MKKEIKNQVTTQSTNHHINIAYCDYNIMKDKLKNAKKTLKHYNENEQGLKIVILIKESIIKLTSEIILIKSKYNF